MLELGSALVVGSSYAASLVAQHCAGEAVEVVWERIKKAFRDRKGREIEPSDLTGEAAELLQDTAISTELQAIYRNSTALRRAELVARVFEHASILWCDDRPESIKWERELLEQLQTRVAVTETNAEALGAVKAASFDAVVSDIDRTGRPLGLELPHILHEHCSTPVIFYVGYVERERGVPPGSFGITSNPDELLHLICDVLERRRI